MERDTSPAFALFQRERLNQDDKCYDILRFKFNGFYEFVEWDEAEAVAMELFFNNIYESLHRQFSLGEASALDQNEYGGTLLDVSRP